MSGCNATSHPGARPARSWLFAACVAITTSAAGCSDEADIVFLGLTVEFAQDESHADEAVETTTVSVRSSAANSSDLEVTYEVVGGSAAGHDDCSARDYALPMGRVVIPAGETEAEIQLSHLDDRLPEVDETLLLQLTSVSGGTLGVRGVHTHYIDDDDRGALLDVVRDFGAAGDGATDDTDAVAAAVERAETTPGSVVVFPPGRYAVVSVALAPGVSYYGHGAVITRPPAQAEDLSSLSVRFSGAADSEPLLVSGLTLDGNRDEQGAFQDWQFQDSDLLNAAGEPESAGNLRLIVEDVTVENTGGSGLVLGPNVDATLCRLRGIDVWTDVIKMSGGSSTLRARDVEAGGALGTTGMTLTTLAPGPNDDYRVDVELDRVLLHDGDLEISVFDGSTVSGTDVHMDTGPFYVRAPRATVRFEDSTFFVGAPEGRLNRFVAPGDVTFERSRFVLTETVEPTSTLEDADRELVVANVHWDDVRFGEDGSVTVAEVLDDQRLVFDGCTFGVDDDVEDGDTTYVVATSEARNTNIVIVRGNTTLDGFDDLFAPLCGSCLLESP